MKEIIQIKDVTRPKITIAKDEIRIKIPIGTTENQKERILTFCKYVYETLGSHLNTKRGNIHMDSDGKLYTNLNGGTLFEIE